MRPRGAVGPTGGADRSDATVLAGASSGGGGSPFLRISGSDWHSAHRSVGCGAQCGAQRYCGGEPDRDAQDMGGATSRRENWNHGSGVTSLA